MNTDVITASHVSFNHQNFWPLPSVKLSAQRFNKHIMAQSKEIPEENRKKHVDIYQYGKRSKAISGTTGRVEVNVFNIEQFDIISKKIENIIL